MVKERSPYPLLVAHGVKEYNCPGKQKTWFGNSSDIEQFLTLGKVLTLSHLLIPNVEDIFLREQKIR
jgi:hypothetical protein